MIVVIDYGAGNLCSVTNALTRLGVNYLISNDKETIKSAEKVIFPGVGEASSAMTRLEELGLVEVIKSLKQPFLGICLGMQLLCESSEEGDAKCLGIIPCRVKKMTNNQENKVPHIGWNNINELKSYLFKNVNDGDFTYYVHSYAVPLTPYTICTTQHSEKFSGAVQFQNFYGCQFHPEKSGSVGEQIIKNFIEL